MRKPKLRADHSKPVGVKMQTINKNNNKLNKESHSLISSGVSTQPSIPTPSEASYSEAQTFSPKALMLKGTCF